MTINYSLEDEIVKETTTIPEKEEVKDLGEKDKVLADLAAEIVRCQSLITSYTAMIVEVQTKIDAINALE